MRSMPAAALLALLLPLPLLADEIVSLSFTGARYALNPAFDEDIARYSLILDGPSSADTEATADEPDVSAGSDDGVNGITDDSPTPSAKPLALLVETRDGTSVLVDGVEHASGIPIPLPGAAPGQRLRVALADAGSGPDADADADAGAETNDDAGTEVSASAHEVVLLPSDFPNLRTRVLEETASDDPLYLTLVDPPVFYVAKVDNHGVPYFFLGDDREVFDFRRHAVTGEHSYGRRTGTVNDWKRNDTERVVLDEDFVERARLTTTGLSHTGHHEFEILDDDRLLMMAYDGRRADLTAHGQGDDEVVEDSVFQVLSREDGAIEFAWSTREHVAFDEQTHARVNNEYAHLNAVSVDTDGHYLASFRGLSQILKISSETGEVLWRLGGKRGDFRFVDDPLGGLCGQHFPQRLGNGNLLIFDNGQNCWPPNAARGERTRVVEYALDLARGEARLVWDHERPDAYAQRQGSAQRLANGHTLIGWGFGPDVLASEVTSAGETVFELGVEADDDTPVHGYRVYRFAD